MDNLPVNYYSNVKILDLMRERTRSQIMVATLTKLSKTNSFQKTKYSNKHVGQSDTKLKSDQNFPKNNFYIFRLFHKNKIPLLLITQAIVN